MNFRVFFRENKGVTSRVAWRVVRAACVIVNQGKVILDREQRLAPMPRSAKHFLTIPGLRPLDRWVREDPIAGNSWTKQEWLEAVHFFASFKVFFFTKRRASSSPSDSSSSRIFARSLFPSFLSWYSEMTTAISATVGD